MTRASLRRLSGGERQRGAVARALINDPPIILADEPTGNVDSGRGAVILELLTARCRSRRATVLIATHSHDVARTADRVVYLRDGTVQRIAVNDAVAESRRRRVPQSAPPSG